MRDRAAIFSGFSKLLMGAFLVCACLTTSAAADTLAKIKKRGHVMCGVGQDLPGFSSSDSNGNWHGMDVAFCRALAAAVFDNAKSVKFRPLSTTQRFQSLYSGEVDVLSRHTTWTLSRDSATGLRFVGTLYFDGQGFMVRKDLAVASILELSGTSICASADSLAQHNAKVFFRSHKMRIEIVALEKVANILNAYEAKRCKVYTSTASGLAALRLKLAKPSDHVILPEVISNDPLGPAVRQGDEHWFSVVRWTLFALIAAEELNITSNNISAMHASSNPHVRRFLGLEGQLGMRLGLTNDWANRIIKAVGNYGELYARHLGAKSSLRISRGLNRLWNKGGLMYAPPIR